MRNIDAKAAMHIFCIFTKLSSLVKVPYVYGEKEEGCRIHSYYQHTVFSQYSHIHSNKKRIFYHFTHNVMLLLSFYLFSSQMAHYHTLPHIQHATIILPHTCLSHIANNIQCMHVFMHVACLLPISTRHACLLASPSSLITICSRTPLIYTFTEGTPGTCLPPPPLQQRER